MATIVNKKGNAISYSELVEKYPCGIFQVEKREGCIALIKVGALLVSLSEAKQKKIRSWGMLDGLPVTYAQAPYIWVRFEEGEAFKLTIMERNFT